MGSLVLGLSPISLQQLPTNRLLDLLPALSDHAESLSGAQILAVFRNLWTVVNITNRLEEMGPLLYSLPLIQLRKRKQEILSDLRNISHAKWNLQQAQFLFREAAKVRSLQSGIT
ncbi:Hypothetical predicted protein [Pelobates cultripes]|uniref:Uncharacterized protein n=1 Tax=Pelobates cultripes TaxID=61616 RepID=A0AAD1RM52_PELCU|nr:Hypothetical predicted protein [Pelobates cultripes]